MPSSALVPLVESLPRPCCAAPADHSSQQHTAALRHTLRRAATHCAAVRCAALRCADAGTIPCAALCCAAVLPADAADSVPPIKIAWLKKFEGDDMFQVSAVNPSQLPFQWDGTEVEELPLVGLFHQQHYSNFYHLFSEIAPSMHFIMCKFLGDCKYRADSRCGR